MQRVGGQPDRRSTLVSLTAKDITVAGSAMGTHMKREQAMIASLSAADRRALAALLKKLLASIEAEHRKGDHE